jgi:CelD/BcsL family acetyltransferase involved in cellulose biosynthesis
MIAARLLPVFEVTEVSDPSSYLELEKEWNSLIEKTSNEPFYRHEFIRIWIENFAKNETLRILTGRDRSGRLVAVLPMIEAKSSYFGLPFNELSSIANSHSCRSDLIAEDRDAAGHLFFDYLSKDERWDLLKFIDIPGGGNAWKIYEAARSAGFPCGVWESQRSPFRDLPASSDELLKSLRKKLRDNLNRARKRIGEKGAITIKLITDGPELERYLEDCFAIEQSGWKGAEGTAILQDEATRNFYIQFARAAAGRGYLSLYMLMLDSKLIAFQFGLTYNRTYYMPKIGYDEALHEYSPGTLLLEEILKDCISRKLTRVDFLGNDSVWKMRWCKDVLPHNWLFIFRNNRLGRAVRKAKFDLIPAAKQIVERFKAK